MTDYTGANFVTPTRHDTYPAIDPAKADLSGKVVLISGASKGIGKAIALSMAQSGARGLVLLARSDLSSVKDACLSAQRPGYPLHVLTLIADISDNTQVEAAAKEVGSVFGRLDFVINNAGYIERYAHITDSDPDDWWRVWNINVKGTYHVTRAFLPLLIQCGGDKTIVNVVSTGAIDFPPCYSSYCTSKLAILRFTEFVNVEYTDKGVLAYCVHPGAIESDMSFSAPPEIRDTLIDTPEIASHTILWLIKERREWLASRYISCLWDMEGLLAKKQEIIEGDKLKVRLVV